LDVSEEYRAARESRSCPQSGSFAGAYDARGEDVTSDVSNRLSAVKGERNGDFDECRCGIVQV